MAKLQFPGNTRSRRRTRRTSNAGRKPSRRPEGKPKSERLPWVTPYQLLWAAIGLLLTISGTLVEAFVTNSPWQWSQQGIQPQSLGVTCQIGAVLLVGCLGGKKAGAIAQIAYVILGLTGLYPVFTQGGGWRYLLEPTFGYIIGFIPGAWLCGWLAFRRKPKLETLAFSCTIGLFAVHLVGIAYLSGLHLLSHPGGERALLVGAIEKYSLNPLASQFAIVCAVSLIGYILRRILLY
ncbi:biotin transporter BioY [Oscillatoria sp. FACHB-1406]|nr:biotin transporter BioY [Oscillatoria sp. FACHB-1406]